MVRKSGKGILHRLWSKLTTYPTDRQLEVEDLRLGLVHKLCLLGAAVYLVYTVIISHSYMKKEKPNVSVNSWVEGMQEYRELLKEFQQDPEKLPWYCNSSATEYIYSDSFKYYNNTCDPSVFVGDVTMSDSNSIQFVTYYQDKPEAEIGKNRPKNAFVPEVENLYLAFSHSFSTSIGVEGTNVETVFQTVTGEEKKRFAAGEAVSIQISELLQLAGISLNDKNTNSGGLRPENGMQWPLYRMTGVALPLELTFENARPSQPFDFAIRLKVEVAAPKHLWMGRSRHTFAKWNGKDFSSFERFPQVVSVSFDTAGTVGVPHVFEAVVSLAVSAAIFGVVKTVMDVIGRVVVKEFFAMKVVDKQDLQNLDLSTQKAWIYARQMERPGRRPKSKDTFNKINPVLLARYSPRSSAVQKRLR